MSINLKLMPDYGCFALWDVDRVENLDPAELPISEDLKARIRRWEDVYDSTLNQDDPLVSGFRSHCETAYFDDEGRAIWEELKRELGDGYSISYFSVTEARLVSE